MKKEKKKGRLKAFLKKHKILSIIIALVLVAAIVLSGFALKNKGGSTKSYSFIRTTTLARGTLEDTVTSKGTIKSASTSNVTTSLNYTVKSINVAVGDRVEEGDIIITLDTSELEKQIEKEESNLSKQKSSAQSAYNSAKSSYDKANKNYNSYLSTYNSAKSAYETAKAPYKKAVSSLKSYQSAYESALSAFNSAGAKYVQALSDYNSAVSAYKANKSSSNQSKLISAAKAYMSAAQNYYGKCAKGNYNIGTSSSESSSDMMNSGSSSSQSIKVSQTADEICASVISNVKTLAGKTLSKPSGTNTLYKLYQKAEALRNAQTICNFSSLESAYTSAKSAYNEAKQMKSQYKEALSQAKEQLENAKESLENASESSTLDELKSQLEECSLKAEQSGTVTALNATVGSSVGMDSAVATIQDLNNLQVSITIEEADINNVSLGMTCRVTTDAEDDALSGTLTQINPVSSDGSFGATVTINDESDEIYIGMNASVDIIVSSSEEVYQVPIDAVGEENGEKYVYLKTGGSGTDMTFEKVTVTTGASNDYYIEISSSELSEGDVVRSSADLSEGIETVSNSSSGNENSGGLFANLFGGSKSGGDFPGGGDMPSPPSNFSGSSSGSSDSSSGSMPTPPSGGFTGGSNG